MVNALQDVLAPGRIVSTSYGTGPYVVREVHPHPSEGVLSLVLEGAPGSHYKRGPYYINEVRLAPDRCSILCGGGDELYVQGVHAVQQELPL